MVFIEKSVTKTSSSVRKISRFLYVFIGFVVLLIIPAVKIPKLFGGSQNVAHADFSGDPGNPPNTGGDDGGCGCGSTGNGGSGCGCGSDGDGEGV